MNSDDNHLRDETRLWFTDTNDTTEREQRAKRTVIHEIHHQLEGKSYNHAENIYESFTEEEFSEIRKTAINKEGAEERFITRFANELLTAYQTNK